MFCVYFVILSGTFFTRHNSTSGPCTEPATLLG